MGRRAEKHKGPFLDVVDMLRSAFDGHVDHVLTRSFDADDSELCCIYCRDCDEPVVMGSRELIELVWLDAMSGPPTPH